MFVISGVTGNTGSIVAQTLIDQRQAVRVIVRSAEKGASWKLKGAEVAVAEIMDQEAMARALEGASGAYFLLPPDLANEDFIGESMKRAESIVAAAKTARLPHAVILSSVGVQFEDRVGPISTIGHMERQFAKSALPLTAVRPGYFLENIQDVLPAAIHEGVYPSLIHPLDLKIDMVATRDIGLTVSEALLNPPSIPHRVIELRGAGQYSAENIAAELSRTLGRPVVPVAVPQEGWVDQLKQSGLSQQSAESIAEMHENINNGRIDFLDPDARKASIDLSTFIANLTASVNRRSPNLNPRSIEHPARN